MVNSMARRILLAVAALLCAATVVPAAAASRHCRRVGHGRVAVSAESLGRLVAVTYDDRGTARHVRFLDADAAIERVALRDVDNDGDLDVLAAPRDGHLILW